MDDESKCGNCYFWKKSPNPQYEFGACRAHPPLVIQPMVPVSAGDLQIWESTSFPGTSESQWCGEFRHKNRI